MICLTNYYCEGIEKSLTHFQRKCPYCSLWTIWENRKTNVVSIECICLGKQTK